MNLSLPIKNSYVTAIISAAIITAYLFYCDEGYYNFNWIKEPGAWIIYTLYVVVLTLLMIGISSVVFLLLGLFKVQISKATSISVMISVALILVFLLVYIVFRI